MTPEQVGAAFVDRFGVEAVLEPAYGQVTVEVPAASWVAAATFARDELGARFFDWLSAYDLLAEGFAVVLHLYAIDRRFHVLLRTRVPVEAPRLPSLLPVFRGAGWHERETFEMFGITFDGHPNLVPLLLPEGFEGHPLRKTFVLASRVAKAWPGAKEPGEGAEGAPGRRRMGPLGVPDPAEWGPESSR